TPGSSPMSHPVDCVVAGVSQDCAQGLGFKLGQQLVNSQAEHLRCRWYLPRAWRYPVINQQAEARTGLKHVCRKLVLGCPQRVASESPAFDLDHDRAQALLFTGDERGDVNAPVGFPGRSLFGLRSSLTQEVAHKPFELRPPPALRRFAD